MTEDEVIAAAKWEARQETGKADPETVISVLARTVIMLACETSSGYLRLTPVRPAMPPKPKRPDLE